MKKKKWIRSFVIFFLVSAGVICSMFLESSTVYASGLVDDTINENNFYSRYPLENYQLDFYVDNSWGWLPWNWKDSIGKSVMYGLYSFSNVIWTIGLYISNATGYVVQEAYKLDFISDMADSIGTNMQILAGVTRNGFSEKGFYVDLLPFVILAIGIYTAYTGLVKHETSKAIQAVSSFLLIFLFSAGFIAYAPDYIKKVNEFSADVSMEALDLGTKIVLPESEGGGSDSVDMIRDNLFSIQVYKPWLLLQFGTTDVEELTEERVLQLLSINPSSILSGVRDEVVKNEIEEKGNRNLTITQVMFRLGTVLFLFVINFIISVFVLLFMGIMIFSQLLFIVYALFLPFSFLMAMLPSYNGIVKKAVEKVFNVIMVRVGITLIVTVAFCISSMIYSLSEGKPFFLVGFLQIVTFAGIFIKQNEIMGMFALQSNDAQQMGRRIVHKPYMYLRRQARHMERKVGRKIHRAVFPGNAGQRSGNNSYTSSGAGSRTSGNVPHTKTGRSSYGERAGAAAGAVLDIGSRVKDGVGRVKDQVHDLPTNARYTVQKNVSDFKKSAKEEPQKRQQMRAEERDWRRKNVAEKRRELETGIYSKEGKEPETEQKRSARPNVSKEQMEKFRERRNMERKAMVSEQVDRKHDNTKNMEHVKAVAGKKELEKKKRAARQNVPEMDRKENKIQERQFHGIEQNVSGIKQTGGNREIRGEGTGNRRYERKNVSDYSSANSKTEGIILTADDDKNHQKGKETIRSERKWQVGKVTPSVPRQNITYRTSRREQVKESRVKSGNDGSDRKGSRR